MLVSCKDEKPAHDSSEIDGQQISQTHSEIEYQLRRHGVGILFAYYQIGTLDKEQIKQELNIILEEDLYVSLFSKFRPVNVETLKQKLITRFSTFTKKELREEEAKAITYLHIMQVVNSSFCDIWIEEYLDEVYEVPELRALIHSYIDPSQGQSIASLSSTQLMEVKFEVWNFLYQLDKKRRLEIIAELIEGCSKMKN